MSPLFDTERKQHFISHAESYTPKLRRKLIDILEKHEKNVLDYGTKLILEDKERQAKEVSIGDPNCAKIDGPNCA